jgi:hypothetical protein
MDADDDDDGFGFGFWAKIAGVIVVIGFAGLILMLLISRAVYAFGFLGAFVAFAAILLLIAWFYDRRQIEEYEDSES